MAKLFSRVVVPVYFPTSNIVEFQLLHIFASGLGWFEKVGSDISLVPLFKSEETFLEAPSRNHFMSH